MNSFFASVKRQQTGTGFSFYKLPHKFQPPATDLCNLCFTAKSRSVERRTHFWREVFSVCPKMAAKHNATIQRMCYFGSLVISSFNCDRNRYHSQADTALSACFSMSCSENIGVILVHGEIFAVFGHCGRETYGSGGTPPCILYMRGLLEGVSIAFTAWRSDRLTPRVFWVGGYVTCRVSFDMVAKRKSFSVLGIECQTPSPSLSCLLPDVPTQSKLKAFRTRQ
jgi:hypothetical protein